MLNLALPEAMVDEFPRSDSVRIVPLGKRDEIGRVGILCKFPLTDLQQSFQRELADGLQHPEAGSPSIRDAVVTFLPLHQVVVDQRQEDRKDVNGRTFTDVSDRPPPPGRSPR